jgi:hypothetical protein
MVLWSKKGALGFALLPYLMGKQDRLQATGSGKGWRGSGLENV